MAIEIHADREPLLDDDELDSREFDLFRESETQNIAERKKYASRLFFLILGWLAFLVIIILLQGFDFTRFGLPTPVLLAFITTTTAGVIGLLALVLKYLFSTY